MNNLATILVNSCDNYEDCWMPFFKLLKKYWPERKFPIILNTESKKFDYEDMKITTFNIPEKFKEKNFSWSKRLKNVLQRIDSKYIIFMLDDFFITDYVDNKEIDKVINWMENDKSIGVFSFYPVEQNKFEDYKDRKYKKYVLRNRKGPYRYNCQIAVWNRKFLISCLRNYESPWEWELMGNVRSKRSTKKFYCLDKDSDLIFKYDFRNIGVIRGKWLLPETAKLFKKENIKINFDIRNNIKDKEVKKANKIIFYLKRIRSLV